MVVSSFRSMLYNNCKEKFGISPNIAEHYLSNFKASYLFKEITKTLVYICFYLIIVFVVVQNSNFNHQSRQHITSPLSWLRLNTKLMCLGVK